MHTHYIPSNGWTVYILCVLLWFGSDQFYPYSSGLLQWQWSYHIRNANWKIPKKMDCIVRMRRGFVIKNRFLLIARVYYTRHKIGDDMCTTHMPIMISKPTTYWVIDWIYYHIFIAILTHCGSSENAIISQMTVSNAFLSMKVFLFVLIPYCNLFQGVQLISIHQWFK